MIGVSPPILYAQSELVETGGAGTHLKLTLLWPQVREIPRYWRYRTGSRQQHELAKLMLDYHSVYPYDSSF